jgi:hypothetical protein
VRIFLILETIWSSLWRNIDHPSRFALFNFPGFFFIECFFSFLAFNFWLIGIGLPILFWFGFYRVITISYLKSRVLHGWPGSSQCVVVSIFFFFKKYYPIYHHLNILNVFRLVYIEFWGHRRSLLLWFYAHYDQ